MRRGGLEDVLTAGWTFPEPLWGSMDEGGRAFVLNELSAMRTPGYYGARLRAIGMAEHDVVLDAGCGIGQWALTASTLNRRVVGVDLSGERLHVAAELARAQGARNLSWVRSGLEHLPFTARSFDAAMCYGVFMFTDMPRALAELRRVLRPGARLYVNANHIGWYAHLILDRGLRGRRPDIARATLRVLARTVLGRTSEVVVWRRRLRKLLEAAGFDLEGIGPEGSLTPGLRRGVPPPPRAYKSRSYLLPTIVEVVAIAR